MDADDFSAAVAGKVKWYDIKKGYGFIERDDGGRDILLHANVVHNFGRGSVLDGSLIEVTVITTARGAQANTILSITPPEYTTLIPFENFEHVTAEEIALCPLQPARIKRFDRQNGYGFANVFGQEGDIFVHIKILHRGGLANVIEGEAVAIRVMQGQLGPLAVEVLPWDVGPESSR